MIILWLVYIIILCMLSKSAPPPPPNILAPHTPMRPPMYPEMERQLYLEYKQLRKQEWKVKGNWFQIRVKQITKVTNPESAACFSDSCNTTKSALEEPPMLPRNQSKGQFKIFTETSLTLLAKEIRQGLWGSLNIYRLVM